MDATTAQHERDLVFSTTINLVESDNDRFQFIYSTQLYGTFFGLYARFVIEDCKSDDDNIRIREIEFLGVNYKGPINLKIEKIEVSIQETQPNAGVGIPPRVLKVLYIDLTISGRGRGTFTRPPGCRIMPLNLDVPRDASFRVERTLQSLSNFESRTDPNSNEKPKPILPGDAYWEGIFDSEYFIRDGFLIAYRGSLHVFDENTDLQDHETGGMKKLSPGTGAVTINCPIGVGEINPGS